MMDYTNIEYAVSQGFMGSSLAGGGQPALADLVDEVGFLSL